MSVVPKYSVKVPLQLLLHQQPKILSSKYHFIAHWSPWWLIPKLHSRKGTKCCLNVPEGRDQASNMYGEKIHAWKQSRIGYGNTYKNVKELEQEAVQF